jgi:hypothetical protein
MSRKATAESFIHIQVRANGCKYAKYCPSNRKHGGKDVYLGKVIDESRGIFYNRNNGGYYRFTTAEGRTELEAGETEYQRLIDDGEAAARSSATGTQKRLTLDFGDAWFLDHVMNATGLKDLFAQAIPDERDTLLALVAFKLLDNDAGCYAERWLEGSYARHLYPKADLRSQRISEFMERLGEEEVKRRFFDRYIDYFKAVPGTSDNVLIDSTGLPNGIQFDCAAFSNHNGVVSRETRLIYVVERATGLPVYFRYVAGNILDVSTLRVTINELKAQGINVHHSILDAGYCSRANIGKLFGLGISFITRLPDNKTANGLIGRHGSDVFSQKYVVKHGDRIICIKRIKDNILGHDCYVYISIDVDRRHDEQRRQMRDNAESLKKKKDLDDKKLNSTGYFIIISSDKMETKDILPYYYMRQNIEQTFDYAKNDVDLLPLRTHKVETFRGHLLLCFMATAALITVKRQLKTRKKLANLCPKETLKDFRFVKCSVYPKALVTTENNKYVNNVLNELKLEMPETIIL